MFPFYIFYGILIFLGILGFVGWVNHLASHIALQGKSQRSNANVTFWGFWLIWISGLYILLLGIERWVTT